MWKMMLNFTLFDPPAKIGEGVQDLYTNCLSFTYDKTSGINLMDIHCSAAEHRVLIKKNDKVHG